MREGAIVPDVSMMGKAVADVAQTTLLNILFDGVESLLFGDLHFSISPAGDFDDHVEDAVVLVREKRDIMEGGYDRTILFDVDSVV